jgi:hypothetical protein
MLCEFTRTGFLTYQRFRRSLYPVLLNCIFLSPVLGKLLCHVALVSSTHYFKAFFSQYVADATPRIVWSTYSVHIERTYRLVVRSLCTTFIPCVVCHSARGWRAGWTDMATSSQSFLIDFSSSFIWVIHRAHILLDSLLSVPCVKRHSVRGRTTGWIDMVTNFQSLLIDLSSSFNISD